MICLDHEGAIEMSNQFISANKIKMLEERMKALGMEERDIEEKFIHSQGKGGQKVNKSSSCVYLKHIPTGIEVKCQEERSQAMNRFFARRILADRVEEALHGLKCSSAKKIQKIRKQKRKRARRAQEKLVIDDK